MKRTAQPEGDENKTEENTPSVKPPTERPQGARLVTSDGTYATQSAFSMQQTVKKVFIIVLWYCKNCTAGLIYLYKY